MAMPTRPISAVSIRAKMAMIWPASLRRSGAGLLVAGSAPAVLRILWIRAPEAQSGGEESLRGSLLARL